MRLNYILAGTWRLYNVASTSMLRHMTLFQRCIDVDATSYNVASTSIRHMTLYNVASTSMQRIDVEATLYKRHVPVRILFLSFFSENICKLRRDGIVMSGPGKLLCRHILHIKMKGSIDGWRNMIFACLQQAESLGATSIAFPVLGTGELYSDAIQYGPCRAKKSLRAPANSESPEQPARPSSLLRTFTVRL